MTPAFYPAKHFPSSRFSHRAFPVTTEAGRRRDNTLGDTCQKFDAVAGDVSFLFLGSNWTEDYSHLPSFSRRPCERFESERMRALCAKKG